MLEIKRIAFQSNSNLSIRTAVPESPTTAQVLLREGTCSKAAPNRLLGKMFRVKNVLTDHTDCMELDFLTR
jgi:hypothetical protein